MVEIQSEWSKYDNGHVIFPIMSWIWIRAVEQKQEIVSIVITLKV
jgi:hypothetical protein